MIGTQIAYNPNKFTSPPRDRDFKKKSEYPSQVTIVIGFNCSDALLLCADTEITTIGYSKIDASKIFRKEYRNGAKSAIAVAGNLAYGRMAMQHIEYNLETMPSPDAKLSNMRGAIEAEVLQLNINHIYPHPNRYDVSFKLLIALWSAKDNRTALLWVDDSAVNELLGYAAIGAGDYLAHYLVRPKYKATMLERDVRPLAIEAIKAAKNFVPGCGGFTELITLTRSGILGQVERLAI